MTMGSRTGAGRPDKGLSTGRKDTRKRRCGGLIANGAKSNTGTTVGEEGWQDEETRPAEGEVTEIGRPVEELMMGDREGLSTGKKDTGERGCGGLIANVEERGRPAEEEETKIGRPVEGLMSECGGSTAIEEITTAEELSSGKIGTQEMGYVGLNAKGNTSSTMGVWIYGEAWEEDRPA